MDEHLQYIEESKRLQARIAELEKQNGELVRINAKLLEENKRNEEAISNAMVRQEMESKGPKGTRFKMVTVLFSDIKGFSKLTEHIEADALIDELDKFFFQFDEVVSKHNIEKIKSIGDSYICAGGIPKKNRTNPMEVVMAALEMQNYMQNLQREFADENKKIWEMSVGIHTGPVVAEISGKKKISYDIKGDTVNIASRIEAASEGGKITISSMTYEFVRDFFRCEYKGKMPVKYMGDVDIYIVKGFRPEYSRDGRGLMPNEKFWTKFALVQYDDLEEVILDKLEKELPTHLYYHNLKHTIDVINTVEVIGRGEGITEEELLLMKTAALFHDAGHVISSPNHEFYSTQIAREYLQKYSYNSWQIDKICEIIMATKLPPRPKNLLEQIICDSDLDYLGRRDFIPVSDTLFKELKHQNIINNLNDWNKLQVKFLTNHQFNTQTALSLREVNKQLQIERLKALITED